MSDGGAINEIFCISPLFHYLPLILIKHSYRLYNAIFVLIKIGKSSVIFSFVAG